MVERYTMLRVDSVSFDTENPRIKKALEKYGDQLTAERIHFALSSAVDGTSGTSSFLSLRDSIHASDGVKVPITVIKTSDGFVCIDGNTRLAIYKQFFKEGVAGQWSEIKAVVLDGIVQKDIEVIRVTAHLVGAREWPAYEKARYLHYLRSQQFMDYGEMIDLCGGNKSDIERQIQAFHDMNEYYRDVVDDTAFHIERFSGFVELQRPTVKQAIFEAGLELKDFGEWIRDGKIYRLADVRQLPRVLGDKNARNVFLNGGHRSIEDATRLLDSQTQRESDLADSDLTISKASLYRLAEVLSGRISELPYTEFRTLKEKELDDVREKIRILEDLSDRLTNLLQDVSE